jgi:outer membrane immunogenic protein
LSLIEVHIIYSDDAMNRLLLSTAVVALTASTALAADLPTRKAEFLPPPPPPPMWTGFYAGLNAGGMWGTSTGVSNTALPVNDSLVGYVNDWAGPNTLTYVPFLTGATRLANTGFANVNQGGFIGGGQIGYNYQWARNIVVGLEADFQGSTVSGQGGYLGSVQETSSATYANPIFNWSDPLVATGSGRISTGIDWMGTVRGRLGYLVTPTLLAFGTGGLAYGGVHASANHTFNLTDYYTDINNPPPGYQATYPTTFSAGRYSNTLVGWTAGGGLEWMFWPNWSLKTEALYYNLGSASFASSPVAAFDNIGGGAYWSPAVGSLLVANVPITRITYNGVIVRAGVNYHFNWGARY